MNVILKYLLPMTMFVLGLLIGKYLWLEEEVAYSHFTDSNDKGLQYEKIETPDIFCMALANNAVSSNKVVQLDSQPLEISDGGLSKKMQTVKQTAIRFSENTDDSLYKQSNLFWHNQLYLAQELEQKLTAIQELVSLQDAYLLASGLGDDDIDVQLATVEGLQRIATPEAVQVLGQALFSEQNAGVKAEVIEALETLDYLDNAGLFLEYAKSLNSEH